MTPKETVTSVKVPGNTSNCTQNYDAVLETFGKAIGKRSCSTCRHFSLEFGMYPKCSAGPRAYLSSENLDTKGQCTTKYSTSPKWDICESLKIESFLERKSQLNEFLEGDLYEVYEHFTGEFVEVPSGWFSTRRVRESFFYILKNDQGYFCESPYSLRKGFLPLDDYTTMVERGLVTYSTASEAIEQCETFSSWGNKKGNLIYRTGDSLESRFRRLEGKAG